MCGISGIVNRQDNSVSKQEIESITTSIAHRGPDDQGLFLENNFALGHRRLSIIDLSKEGHQPMAYLDRYVIVYNGEIYNYKELKKQLEAHGYRFRSQTDTEVLLAAYDYWGSDALKQFNGMWSFALYDREEKKLFCSRDRFGIKPFYYTITEEVFAFGSEIRQLLSFQESVYADENAILDYLLFNLEGHDEKTFFDGIKRLPPGSFMVYDLESHDYSIQEYYDIHRQLAGVLKKRDADDLPVLQKSLLHSLKLRLRSDVQVGTCLSGGLDSSTITAMAAEMYQGRGRIKSITASSLDPGNDETSYAEMVAKHCNVEHYTVLPTKEDFVASIDEVLDTQEEPFYDPSVFMEFFVMREAARHGVKVMLDGQGSDEILFGYEYNYQVLLATYLKRFRLGRFFALMKNLKTYRYSRMRIAIQSVLYLFPRIRAFRQYKNRLVKKEYAPLNRFLKQFVFRDILEFQIDQLTRTNVPRYLKYQDKSSMHHSVESRVPFLDYRFVEAALKTENEEKFREGYLKYPLRKIAENMLPPQIAWRTDKIGYEAPNRIWLAVIEEEMVDRIHSSAILQKYIKDLTMPMDLNTKWKLYILAKWEKNFSVKIKET